METNNVQNTLSYSLLSLYSLTFYVHKPVKYHNMHANSSTPSSSGAKDRHPPTKTRGEGETDITDQVQDEELRRDRQLKQGKFNKEKEHI